MAFNAPSTSSPHLVNRHAANGHGGGAAGQRGAAARPARPALDKKGNRVSPDEETTAQRGRRLRRIAARWLSNVPMGEKRRDHAVTTCGSYAGYGVEVAGGHGVAIRKGRYGTFFAHQVTCGSVTACPCCAPKVARIRCDQVRDAVDAHFDIGGTVGMLTLTHGHRAGEALAPHLRALQDRWKKLKSGKSWQLFRERVGLVGGVTAREVTHGDHGWHPHLHVLLFFAPGTTTLQIFEALQGFQERWANLARKDGFNVSDRAQNFRLATSGKCAADYVTKFGIEWEMTHSHLKKAKVGRSPWQMLESGTDQDRRLFVEYATAFKGARMLTWFGNVRAEADDSDDYEALSKVNDEADDIAILDADTYRRVVQIGAEDAVLRAAERGFVDLAQVLTFLRCGICYRPHDGRKSGKQHQYPPGWHKEYQR